MEDESGRAKLKFDVIKPTILIFFAIFEFVQIVDDNYYIRYN